MNPFLHRAFQAISDDLARSRIPKTTRKRIVRLFATAHSDPRKLHELVFLQALQDAAGAHANTLYAIVERAVQDARDAKAFAKAAQDMRAQQWV